MITRLPDDLSDEAAKSLMRKKTEKSLPAEAQKAKAGVDCYECEEAKRHAEKARNHWLRKGEPLLSTLLLIVGVAGFGFLSTIPLLGYLFSKESASFWVGAALLLCGLICLGTKFYLEIFKGFSLYYFKTTDGVLHAHLKNPFPEKQLSATDAIKNLSVPLLVKIGYGWFRNSTLVPYTEVGAEIDNKPKASGKIEIGSTRPLYCISDDFKGFKIHKARCDEKTFELKSVTLEDEVGDRISFNNVGEIYELLEYLDKDITSTPYKIACLFGKIKCLRGFFEMLVEEKKEKEEELKTARAEIEKQKELILNYANFEGSLIGWLKGSKDNPNLGKSKHAQVIRQKLEQHAKEVWEKYGAIMSRCMPE